MRKVAANLKTKQVTIMSYFEQKEIATSPQRTLLVNCEKQQDFKTRLIVASRNKRKILACVSKDG